jgi:hypothetical protein
VPNEPYHAKQFREHQLRPDENVISCNDGYIGRMFGSGDAKQINGALILTNQRIVFYRKGIFSEHLQEIDLKAISSVDQKSSLAHRTLSIRGQSCVLEFKTFEDDKRFGQLAGEIHAQRQFAESRGLPALGVADELRKLAVLTNEGVLTRDDLERAKGLFLGKPRPKQDEATRLLRNLYELHCQGALSESEFNMKKWDILAKP